MRELNVSEMKLVSGGEDEEKRLGTVTVTRKRQTPSGGGGSFVSVFGTPVSSFGAPGFDVGVGDIDTSFLDQQLAEFRDEAFDSLTPEQQFNMMMNESANETQKSSQAEADAEREAAERAEAEQLLQEQMAFCNALEAGTFIAGFGTNFMSPNTSVVNVIGNTLGVTGSVIALNAEFPVDCSSLGQ